MLATVDTFRVAWIITGEMDWAVGKASIEISTERFFTIGTNVFNANLLSLEL